VEQEQYPRETIILIILLCLLLHIIFLTSLFFLYHDTNTFENKQTELQVAYDKKMEQLLEKQTKEPLTKEEQKELFEWVSGQAKGNASVIFENEPMDEQGEEDGKEEVSNIVKASPYAKATEDRELAEPVHSDAKEEKPNKDLLAKTTQEQFIEDAPEKQSLEKILSPEITSLTTAADLIPMAKPTTTTSMQQKDKQQVIDQETSSSPEKKVSLADITKGLVQKLNHQSDHLVNALSEKTGHVSAEQIRYERYFKKIEWHFNNSEKIHRSSYINSLAAASKQIKGPLKIYLALNRNGSLLDLKIIQSCGAPVIDDYFIFILRDASSSFPPVPNFLPAPLPFTYSMGIEAEQKSPIRFTIT